MTKITKEQVLKIAQLSNITVHDTEIDALVNQLEAVLTYAARVADVAKPVDATMQKNVNVFRKDEIIKTNADVILSRSPEQEAHYFVVPAILESTK